MEVVLFDYKDDYIYLSVYLSVYVCAYIICACVCRCCGSQGRAADSSGAGLSGGCELLDVHSGNWIWALCRSSSLLNHF